MKLSTAFTIVLDLAEQNIIDKRDNLKEHRKQSKALSIVSDYAENEQQNNRFE